MTFAESQLKKYGWTKGKGLGRNEHGSSEALRVNLKFDQHGVGHANDMGFQWWNHVFNKAASKIVIQEDDADIRVSSKTEDPTVVSAKLPSKKASSVLYGAFVRASEPSSADQSDDKSEQETKDFSVLLPEDALFKACGGRTAHKAARHGHNLDGKLQRVLEQEKAYLQETGGRKRKPEEDCESDEQSISRRKKKSKKDKDNDKTEKKKKSKRKDKKTSD